MPRIRGARSGLALPYPGGRRLVDDPLVGDHHTVLPLGGGSRHVTQADIGQNMLRISPERLTETATPGGILADDVVSLQRNHAALRQEERRREPLIRCSAVDHIGGLPARLPAEEAPRRHLTAIAEDRQLRAR